MIKNSILLILTFFVSLSAYSQQQERDPGHLTCGKEHYTARYFALHPEEREAAEQARKNLERETKEFEEQKDGSRDVLLIPVVFHIVHVGGEENISDEQIHSAIDVLNEDFNAANDDIGNVVDEFADIVGDVELEFALAKKDPNGNCTNGINRIFSELTDDGFEDMKDAAPIWDRSSYMNIWVCRNIGQGVAGYTYVPSTVNGFFGTQYDGIVILHDYVGRIGTSNANRSHALSHEVGHWANLEHTWGITNQPGVASNCNQNDFVSDTPNTIGWTSCDLDGETCGSLDNVENFMDYSYCYKMFTIGQSNRMRAAMNSSTAQRNQLYTPQNLLETGVLDPDVICFADFQIDRDPKICAGQEIAFDDISFNGVEEWEWTFEGGTPSSSTDPNPTVLYEQPGSYSVTLTVSNAQGEETVFKDGFITVIDGPQYALPFQEGFESLNDIEETGEWVDINQDGGAIKWEITEQAAYSGNKSVYVRGRSNVDFQIEILESPTFDLTNIVDNAVVSFKYAHARRNFLSDDLFRVRISRNCGENWNVRETIDMDDLPTVNNNVSSQFFPDDQDEWQEVIIDNISSIFLTDEFRIRFEFTSVNGNNLFVDDINIYDPNTLSTESYEVLKSLSIYPNPATDRVRLNLELTKSQNVTLDIVDASGRVVQSPFSGFMPEGPQNMEIQLDRNVNSGLYFIRMVGEDGVSVRKLIVQ
jgi:PKD repeat protein